MVGYNELSKHVSVSMISFDVCFLPDEGQFLLDTFLFWWAPWVHLCWAQWSTEQHRWQDTKLNLPHMFLHSHLLLISKRNRDVCELQVKHLSMKLYVLLLVPLFQKQRESNNDFYRRCPCWRIHFTSYKDIWILNRNGSNKWKGKSFRKRDDISSGWSFIKDWFHYAINLSSGTTVSLSLSHTHTHTHTVGLIKKMLKSTWAIVWVHVFKTVTSTALSRQKCHLYSPYQYFL